MLTSKRAAAIKYVQNEDTAPRVIAKGKGYVAEKIIEIAEKNKVPVVQDPNLVQVLEALDLNAEIPPELYRAVAEILAFVYRLNSRQ